MKRITSIGISLCLILLLCFLSLPLPALGGQTLQALEEGGETTTEFSDKAKVTISVLETNPLNHKKSLRILVQLKLPYTRSDIDIPGEDREENYYRPSEYQKGYFEPDKTEIVNKWDQTRFLNSTPVWVDQNTKSIEICIDGTLQNCPIPSSTAQLETKHLEDAITEHENAYAAAMSAGMKIVEGSEKAFLKEAEVGKSLIQSAKQNSSNVTQQDIDNQRERVNQAFSEIQPAPFEREPLQQLIKKAQPLVANNGKDGLRYTRATWEPFYRSYVEARRLVSLPDLRSLTGTIEGEPPTVHRDFDVCTQRLQDAMQNLKSEKYESLDWTALREALKRAIECEPDPGKVYTESSYSALDVAWDDALFLLEDPYATQETVKEKTQALQKAINGLEQISEPKADAFDLSIRYRHQAEDAVSEKIDDYFSDDSGHPIEEILPQVVPGRILKLPLSDLQKIKVFAGYTPTTYFYAMDDTSKGRVKLRQNAQGAWFVVFRAEKNGHLDIKYERGIDLRAAAPNPNKPDQPEKPDQPSKPSKNPIGPVKQRNFGSLIPMPYHTPSPNPGARIKDVVPNTGAGHPLP